MALKDPLRLETRRIELIREEIFGEPYSICLERPTLLDRYWRSGTSRGKHPYDQRAEALAYIYKNRRPRVYRHELIFGNMSSKRIAANYYPEGGSIHILEDIFSLEKRPVMPYHLDKQEKRKLFFMGLRHFKRSLAARAFLKPGWIGHFLDFFRAKRYYITEVAGISHLVPGHESVIRLGLEHFEKEAEAKLAESGGDTDREAFYRGLGIVIEGIRQMVFNLADQAELEAAEQPAGSSRSRELLEGAEILRRVPYKPARTFREGLQAAWLIHLALNLEDFEQGISFGRLDQFLYPLYKKDLTEGRLTPDLARELLASFCLKCAETIPLYSRRINRFFGGNAVGQGITVGGVDADGLDTTNELSRLILEAYSLAMTREPSLHARLHSGSPEWFWDCCTGLIQKGSGKPALFNDKPIIEALQEAGMSIEHARDYAVIGCVEMGSQGRTYNSSDAALFNLPLCLELALNSGRRFGGGHRLGAKTPPPSAIKTYPELVAAFYRQVEHSAAEMVKVITELEKHYRVIRPSPLNSLLTEGCMENGRDVTWGGALYDYTSIQGVGLADTGESLYALKKMVFDEQKLSLSEFVNILKKNFRGEEKLQARLNLRIPRYGNNHEEVDEAVQEAADIFSEIIGSYRNSRGGRYLTGFYAMTCHHGFGTVTGALPNGRLAGFRLSNGLSPVDGADRKGPTAALNSAAGLDNKNWANCYALNLKFEKSLINGDKGIRALKDLIRGYFEQGGMELQINVQDSEQLRQARENPALYPGLMVRVSGYCSYFCDLSPEVQEEIIERTAHSLSGGRGC